MIKIYCLCCGRVEVKDTRGRILCVDCTGRWVCRHGGTK